MPLEVDIPGRGRYDLSFLVLDMNGTVALDGRLLEGVAERVHRLKHDLRVWLITADTHGGAQQAADLLGVELTNVDVGAEAEQKAMFVNERGATMTVAIGNGANDAGMLRSAAVGIAVLGAEGSSAAALAAADVVCRDINEALDLLVNPRRLAATLRR